MQGLDEASSSGSHPCRRDGPSPHPRRRSALAWKRTMYVRVLVPGRRAAGCRFGDAVAWRVRPSLPGRLGWWWRRMGAEGNG